MTKNFDEMEREVNARHQEALQALATLRAYFADVSLIANGKVAPRTGTGKIRPAVIEACKDDYRLVEEIAETSGFSKAQVRGAILSPGLREQFTKKEINGRVAYKFVGGDPMK